MPSLQPPEISRRHLPILPPEAGILSREHPDCRRTYQAGWNEMVELATHAAKSHEFHANSLQVALTEIALAAMADVDSGALARLIAARCIRPQGREDPTDNEGVRRVMQGIPRTHDRAQRQAKPLTAEALAAVKATAKSRRSLGTDGRRQESAERAAWRGRVDVALLSILRDGLLRRSEAAALTWADVDLRDNGSALLQIHRSKTDPEGEGVVLYIGKEAGEALRAIRPAELLLDQLLDSIEWLGQELGSQGFGDRHHECGQLVCP